MVSFHKIFFFFLIFILYLNEKAICSINENENDSETVTSSHNVQYNDNIEQLKSMIGNDELHKNLTTLEKLILESLEKDKLKYPLLKQGTEELIDISKFKKKNVRDTNDEWYILPTIQSTFDDMVKYEHLMKKQLIEIYNSDISDIIKKKIFIVRTLKTIKLMLIPLNSYKQQNDLKAALEELNNVFISKDVEEKTSPVGDHGTFFNNLLTHVRTIKENQNIENKGETLLLEDNKVDVMDTNDFFFTTNSNINFMEALDDITNQYGLGLINHLGPHLIALGHFIVLKLALKNYNNYFQAKSIKFFSWQKILEFSMSDRFKVLDMMCDHESVYYSEKKRRKTYLKVDRSHTSMECNILEYLIHYFNKYQLEIIKTTQDTDFDLHGMMEHKYIKDYFFSFMCNDPKECIIYHTNQFKKEANEENTFPEQEEPNREISAYNIYLNYYYFMKRYSSYGTKKTLYVHLLNLTGLLNYDTRAYVTSLYLPGYYNTVEMSFTEEKEFSKLFENLLKCIEKCHLHQPNTLSKDSNFLNDVSKCDVCKGAFLYSNIKFDDVPSMVQKFYVYLTKGLKIQKVSSLIRTLDIYQEYSNFLSHDINWYTFLFLFRLTSFKDISTKNIAEAMYLNIKDEDSFNKTVVTNYWFPSPIKKYYTLYVRKRIPNNLVDELEKLMKVGTLEKMKKSLTFLVHVNSFLQLDFFHQLNEPPLGLPRSYPLSLILEHKFKDWMISSPAGFYFSNYHNPYIRKDLHDKVLSQKFEPPKMNQWNKVLKSLIECAYDMYFDQRHVKNLYKYHNIYNINNKLMLMRDSMDLYKTHFDDVLFFADIFNMRKYMTATPTYKKVKDRVYHTLHSIMGNSVNFYNYGIIYGFKVNKDILKEVVDELFSIYNFNTDIFSDTSFLQTAYLLFRRIEETYRTPRRNDKMSVNNVFFMNVANNYSKLNKEERELEIHNSMASRYYAKTMFAAFQMLFSTMLSNNVDNLDKAYGLSENIQVATSTSAFLTFAYVYNGSIMDSMTNSLLPPYAKKPITQLKYGKTFVFSNYFMLASKMYDMLNYKNLSLLCEYQAVASANFYSAKKVGQFIGRKFLPITTYFLIYRISWTHAITTGKHLIPSLTDPQYNPSTTNTNTCIHSTEKTTGGSCDPSKCPNYTSPGSFFFTHSLAAPASQYLFFYFFTNLYLDAGKHFPGGFGPAIKEQTQHVSEKTYERKPSVHSFNRNFFVELANGFMYAFCFFTISQMYAYFENINFYITSNFRFLERYYGVFNKYFINYARTKLKEITSDILIKYEREAYLSMKKYGYLGEVIASRLSSKDKIMNYLHDTNEETMNNLRRYDMENAFKNKMATYVDDFAFFDDCGRNEQFLNERCDYCPVVEEVEETQLQPQLLPHADETTNLSKESTSTYIDVEKINETGSADSEDDEKDFDEPDDELMVARFH
ncbi:cytoadherence linked asexual protein 3.1, putative [Plasmodium sp. gorilla clade G2]|uniref:cytoadherence linked asexual protein 3.1, putative n=1 Tax=Plasmodium sp. gorilla clade G2 TaxID=880535 RepID=UPI000D27D7F4|nr:cytoadherence linked asexual protein 3.1, putative [Plasmodium sp. gorilla clade G2]SOV20023.1 cytoadherence linked asexual protein 3.1, putative [Plasmodium sp. gorilla clade G2]